VYEPGQAPYTYPLAPAVAADGDEGSLGVAGVAGGAAHGGRVPCRLPAAGLPRAGESGDILIRDIGLPDPAPGDVLAVSFTGAYNHSMAMNYNHLPRPAMVLGGGGRAEVIIERETYADFIARESIPDRLADRRPPHSAGTRTSA